MTSTHRIRRAWSLLYRNCDCGAANAYECRVDSNRAKPGLVHTPPRQIPARERIVPKPGAWPPPPPVKVSQAVANALIANSEVVLMCNAMARCIDVRADRHMLQACCSDILRKWVDLQYNIDALEREEKKAKQTPARDDPQLFLDGTAYLPEFDPERQQRISEPCFGMWRQPAPVTGFEAYAAKVFSGLVIFICALMALLMIIHHADPLPWF